MLHNNTCITHIGRNMTVIVKKMAYRLLTHSYRERHKHESIVIPAVTVI